MTALRYWDLSEDQRDELRAFLEAAGYASNQVAADGQVEQGEDGRELHLREYLLNDKGEKYVDPDQPDEPATRDFVLPLGDALPWLQA